MVSHFIVYIGDTVAGSQIVSVQASTELFGLPNVCNNFSSWNDAFIEQKVDCFIALNADKAILTFTTSTASVRGLCKIGIFAPACTDTTPSIVEDSWTGGSMTFDLLEDTAMTKALPTLTITPNPCYTTTW